MSWNISISRNSQVNSITFISFCFSLYQQFKKNIYPKWVNSWVNLANSDWEFQDIICSLNYLYTKN